MKKLVFLISPLCLLLLLLATCGSSGLEIKTSGPTLQAYNSSFNVKVYIENSGSMDGYMANGSEFKDAIYSYVSALNSISKSTQINYINSTIIPLGIKVGDLVQHLNPTAFKTAGGTRGNSEFKQILGDIISKADNNNVVVFASDCILDIPSGSAAGFLGITQTDIENIVTEKLKKLPTLGICIYQLESKYSGYYYFPKGGRQPCNEKRPYYMWIIGSQRNLAHILRSIPESKIQHGIKNYCAFAPTVNVNNSLFAAGKPVEKATLKSKHGNEYSCQLIADLSLSLQNDKYLSNSDNYYSTTKNIKTESVQKLPTTSNASHIMNLSISDAVFSDFLCLKAQGIPKWVNCSNGTKDDMIESGKTFSLSYIIGGVAAAYESKYKDAIKITLTTRKK